MFEFLKSETFNVVASFILGLGLMAILKPGCKGESCKLRKAPPFEEVKTSVYQLGSKCFKFDAEPMDCPKEGVIEPFERMAR